MGHKVIFRTSQWIWRSKEKYVVTFRYNVLKSLLNSIHYVGEIIFNLIIQENNITVCKHILETVYFSQVPHNINVGRFKILRLRNLAEISYNH